MAIFTFVVMLPLSSLVLDMLIYASHINGKWTIIPKCRKITSWEDCSRVFEETESLTPLQNTLLTASLNNQTRLKVPF